jgi:hypothetical protein
MNATDLANYALAHIGEPKISNIDDAGSKEARICKQLLTPIIQESLRKHRWNCAIKRATLSALVETPNHHYTTLFQLPTDFMRLLELNGEPAGDSDEFFEIEGKRIATNSDTAEIRYIAEIEVSEFDPLLTKAVAMELASSISVPLTAKLELQTQCKNLARIAISEARQIDAIEVGTREGRPFERVMSQSRLNRARFNRFSPYRIDPNIPN